MVGFGRFSRPAMALLIPLALVARSTMALTRGQDASYELGEPSFLTSTPIHCKVVPTPGSVSAQTLASPHDVAIGEIKEGGVWKRALFVADTWGARVLVYDLSTPMMNQKPAIWVLGRLSLTGVPASDFPPFNSFLSRPMGLAFDPVRKLLFVADPFRSAVLIYDFNQEITAVDHWDYVLGQVSGTGAFSPCNGRPPDSLPLTSGPNALAYDSARERLYVSDTIYNRVTVFDVSPTHLASNIPAYRVLGQPNFTNTSANAGHTDPQPNGFDGPWGVAIDPSDQQLFVSDYNNHRVMIFDLAGGITNGMAASHVLGQEDFVSRRLYGPRNLFHFGTPTGVAVDSTYHRFFVSDMYNNRVLEYHLADGIVNGMSPPTMVGHKDWGTSGIGGGTWGFFFPMGLASDSANNSLFVVDYCGGRVMHFGDLPPGMVFACAEGEQRICGRVKTDESGVALAQVPVELHEGSGALVKVRTTDENGYFVFGPSDGVSLTQSYYLNPVPQAEESAQPILTTVPTVPFKGIDIGDMHIQGRRATFAFSGVPAGTLILVSKTPTGASVPALNTTTTGLYSVVADADGKASVRVPASFFGSGVYNSYSYYLTYWLPRAEDVSVKYCRVADSAPHIVSPGELAEITGPSTCP